MSLSGMFLSASSFKKLLIPSSLPGLTENALIFRTVFSLRNPTTPWFASGRSCVAPMTPPARGMIHRARCPLIGPLSSHTSIRAAIISRRRPIGAGRGNRSFVRWHESCRRRSGVVVSHGSKPAAERRRQLARASVTVQEYWEAIHRDGYDPSSRALDPARARGCDPCPPVLDAHRRFGLPGSGLRHHRLPAGASSGRSLSQRFLVRPRHPFPRAECAPRWTLALAVPPQFAVGHRPDVARRPVRHGVRAGYPGESRAVSR